MRKLMILILGVNFLSCNQSQTKQENILLSDRITQHIAKIYETTDTVFKLFNIAFTKDTLEYYNWEPFLFFKSGHIINQSEKNAVIVRCTTDTTYLVKFYSIQGNKWKLNDSINGLDAYPVQFDMRFIDFNFDNQSDIYIQVSVSNGFGISKGHLLIVNPMTKKLIEHNEARDLGNLRPDPKTNTVISEVGIWCKLYGYREICKWTNKWVNGQIKTIKKDCPCEPEE